jgi:hypothetical protein
LRGLPGVSRKVERVGRGGERGYPVWFEVDYGVEEGSAGYVGGACEGFVVEEEKVVEHDHEMEIWIGVTEIRLVRYGTYGSSRYLFSS